MPRTIWRYDRRDSASRNIPRHPRGCALALLVAVTLSGWASAGCDSPTSPASGLLSSPVAGAPFPYASPEEVGLDRRALIRVADSVRAWVDGGTIVGAELLLVKNRRIVLHEAMGWSDRERGISMERNSLFRMRSQTKPFVGTSILMLAEAGQLALDDRVADHLPSFDNPRSREITLRQLLTHTGGFAHVRDVPWPRPFYTYPSLRAAVDEIGIIGPSYPPGTGYRYSDKGTATLGAVAAEVSGLPLERFIETRILQPLGLADTHTLFTPNVSWAPRMNASYLWNGSVWERYWDNTMDQLYPFFRACGGLYSTVFDYARFLALWMDGGTLAGTRLLEADAVRQALEDRVPVGSTSEYAYQWRIWFTPPPAGTLPIFGHTGASGTLGAAIPQGDALLLYFTQSEGTPTRDSFLEMVVPILTS